MSSPKWARRSTAGSLVCTQEMRVRVPPGPPLSSGAVVQRQDPRLSTGRRGIDTRQRHQSPTADAAGPWTAHNRSEQGSTPWSASTHDSFNGRTAVLQAAYRGSIPRSCTIALDGERGLKERRGAVAPGRCRFDSGRSPQSSSSGRRVIGSPPASGAGAWRFESSRPDHWQIVQRQDSGL